MDSDADHQSDDRSPTSPIVDSVVARRLAIVDDAGVERIVLEVDGELARVFVRTPDSSPGRSTGVEIVALSSLDGGAATVGVNFSVDGNIVTSLETTDDHSTVYAS